MTDSDFPLEVAPEQADEAIRQREARFLDVRTVEEFREGHPAGALNIPIVFVNPVTGQGQPNPDFLAVVRAHFDPDDEIYCGCRSGPRSLQATMLLRQAGFSRVANVQCGFHGKTDPLGRPVAPGWKERELPSTEGEGGERSWERLRAAIEDPEE